MLIYIIFFFILGSCIGSFLNVVVWRLPRVETTADSGLFKDFLASFHALSDPPSHCPKCNTRLKWYDNLPVVGWIKLGGKCRFCKQPISIRYPIVEAITGSIFAFYFIAYYIWQWNTTWRTIFDMDGMTHQVQITHWILSESWPIFVAYLILLAGLLASSLIDIELYIIPTQIPWIFGIIGIIIHTIADRPNIPGSLNLIGSYGQPTAALAAGGAIGLIISMVLWSRDIIPTSFPEGEPLLDVDRAAIEKEIAEAKVRGEEVDDEPLPPPATPAEIRREIRKEIIFLLPPVILGAIFLLLQMFVPVFARTWADALKYDWLSGLLGSLFGAMIGALIVWITRILGTLVARRVAMGLGDVHLMFGVGAVIGAGGATVAFFIAPFFGILVVVWMLVTRKGREMPLGPYLSLATAFVMLAYSPISAYLTPGLKGIVVLVGQWFGR